MIFVVIVLPTILRCLGGVKIPEVDNIEVKVYPGKIIGRIPVKIVVRAYKGGVAVGRAGVVLKAYPQIGIFSRSQMLTDNQGFAVSYFYPELLTDLSVNTVEIEVRSWKVSKSVFLDISFPHYVTVSATPENIPYNGGSSVLKVKVFDKSGTPISGVKIEFFPPSGQVNPKIAETNDAGEVEVTYVSSASTGTQKISFSVGGVFTSFVPVSVISPVGLGTILFEGFDPPVVFLKDSGGRNVSRVSFRVVDSFGNPIKGVEVAFFLKGPNGGEAIFPQVATSDEDGRVQAYVISGIIPGPVRVISQAVDNRGRKIEVASGALHMSSGVFSNRHFSVSVVPRNVPGFVVMGFPFSLTAFLADRFGVAINTKAAVVGISEVGAIIPEIEDLGGGVVMFKARVQEPMPQEVVPEDLEEIAENEIIERYRNDFDIDLGDKNPRDGWATILVMAVGEEEFFDLNGNGVYDDGEPFVDQGEPFIDVNDNGEFDENQDCAFLSWDTVVMSQENRTTSCELFIDINRNGKYDGPNGKWDKNTVIWKKQTVVFSGEPKLLKCILGGEGLKALVADERGNPVPGTKIYKQIVEESIDPQTGQTETRTREELMGEVTGDDFIPGDRTTIFTSSVGGENIISISLRIENPRFKTQTIPCGAD